MSNRFQNPSRGYLHAITVIKEPAEAPAAPKQAMVEKFGIAPGVLACINGSTPKLRSNQGAYAYFDRWYIENETVRTSVTLAIGAVTPVFHESDWIYCL